MIPINLKKNLNMVTHTYGQLVFCLAKRNYIPSFPVKSIGLSLVLLMVSFDSDYCLSTKSKDLPERSYISPS